MKYCPMLHNYLLFLLLLATLGIPLPARSTAASRPLYCCLLPIFLPGSCSPTPPPTIKTDLSAFCWRWQWWWRQRLCITVYDKTEILNFSLLYHSYLNCLLDNSIRTSWERKGMICAHIAFNLFAISVCKTRRKNCHVSQKYNTSEVTNWNNCNLT